jgi:hypothetical protein
MIDGAPSLVNFPTQELLRRRWSSCVSSSQPGSSLVGRRADAGAPSAATALTRELLRRLWSSFDLPDDQGAPVAPSALTKELRGRGANSAPCSLLLLLLLRCAVRTCSQPASPLPATQVASAPSRHSEVGAGCGSLARLCARALAAFPGASGCVGMATGGEILPVHDGDDEEPQDNQGGLAKDKGDAADAADDTATGTTEELPQRGAGRRGQVDLIDMQVRAAVCLVDQLCAAGCVPRAVCRGLCAVGCVPRRLAALLTGGAMCAVGSRWK